MKTTKEKINTNGSPVVSTGLDVKVKKPYKWDSKRAKEMSKKALKSPRHGKHGKLKKTLAKEEVYRMVQEKLAERALKLIDTQTVVAHGTIKIYKIHYHWEGSGKKRTLIKDKPEIVTNDNEIIHVIDWEFGSREMGDPNEHDHEDEEYEFFFVNTQDPDNRAIESQLNRVFGKAPQKLDLTPGGKIGIISGMQIIISEADNEDENGDPV